MRILAACVVSWLVLFASDWVSFGFSWPTLLSSALTVGVLYIAAAASRARGWPLFWLLTALYAGIGPINIQIEGFAFGMFSAMQVARDALYGVVKTMLATGVLTLGMNGSVPASGPPPPRGLASRLWLRLALVALSYVVLYLVAGSLIYPLVKHYYQTSGVVVVPPIGVIVAVQVLRGLVYAAALLPLLRRISNQPQAALVAGLCLSVFAGIAPLLLPVDDILPPGVRSVHMLEIFGSNFTLGVIAALLLVRRARSDDARSDAAWPVPDAMSRTVSGRKA